MTDNTTQPLALFDPVAAPSAVAGLALRDDDDAGVARDLAQAEHVVAAPDGQAELASDANEVDQSAGERRCAARLDDDVTMDTFVPHHAGQNVSMRNLLHVQLTPPPKAASQQ